MQYVAALLVMFCGLVLWIFGALLKAGFFNTPQGDTPGFFANVGGILVTLIGVAIVARLVSRSSRPLE